MTGHRGQRARRVLVAGSRDWTNAAAIRDALAAQWGDGTAVLVHGACPAGADRIAEMFWTRWGGAVERHPADWDGDGRSAGLRRNADMVTAGADVCLAFIQDNSPGSSHTAAAASAAGITTHRHVLAGAETTPTVHTLDPADPAAAAGPESAALDLADDDGNPVHALDTAEPAEPADSPAPELDPGVAADAARLADDGACEHRHAALQWNNAWSVLSTRKARAAAAGDQATVEQLRHQVREAEAAIRGAYAACDDSPKGDAHKMNKGVTPHVRDEARAAPHPLCRHPEHGERNRNANNPPGRDRDSGVAEVALPGPRFEHDAVATAADTLTDMTAQASRHRRAAERERAEQLAHWHRTDRLTERAAELSVGHEPSREELQR